MKEVAAALFCSVFLLGCATPGIQMKASKAYADTFAADELNEHLNFIAITPLLVDGLQKASTASRRNVALDQGRTHYEYRIGPGDVLNIVVWDHPSLNRNSAPAPVFSSPFPSAVAPAPADARNGTVVDSAGTIFYPYAGRIRVEGLSSSQVREVLTRRLGRYIRSPQVDVTVAAFYNKRIQVGGAVSKPTQLALSNVPMTVLDAVNMAGGVKDNADTHHVKWTHQGITRTLSLYDVMHNGDASQNHLLGPDDIVFVPGNDQMRIHVFGETTKQASFQIPEGGLTLTDALGRADGINQSMADARGVFVIRNAPNPTSGKLATVYQLNLKDASAFALGNRFSLEPNDVVFVTTAPVSRWNRVVSQIVPTLSTLGLLGGALK